ncbi:MAG: LacI family DNA-binding transcriptional regulator [Pleomorphochaeta sp.]
MTIYDIAKEAGVSASTVSRVINNKPGIKDATKLKVQKIIEKYDFHLDDNAKSLVTKVTKLIGILLADIRLEHHNNISYIISNKLVEYGYCTIVLNVGKTEEEIDKAVKILRQRKVDSLILIGSVFQVPETEKAISKYFSNIPVIMANGYFNLDNVYGIEINEYEGIRDSVSLFYKKGYKKIAFIGELNTVSNKSKCNGYIDEMKCRGKRDEILVLDLANEDNTFEKVSDLFKANRDIDSIIFSDDIILFKHLRYLEKLGKNIPNDLGLIGVNNDFFCTLTTPTITTVDNKMEDTALAVVNTLIGVLNGEKKVKRIMLFTNIIERESTNKIL